MARLEDLTPGAVVRGVVVEHAVTIVQVQWHGTTAVTLTYRDDLGRVGETRRPGGVNLAAREEEAENRLVSMLDHGTAASWHTARR